MVVAVFLFAFRAAIRILPASLTLLDSCLVTRILQLASQSDRCAAAAVVSDAAVYDVTLSPLPYLYRTRNGVCQSSE